MKEMISVLTSPFFLSHYNTTSEATRIFPSFVFAFANILHCLLKAQVLPWNPQTACNLPFFSGDRNILKRLSCPFLWGSGFGNNGLSEISVSSGTSYWEQTGLNLGKSRGGICLQRSIYILWHDLSGETWSWGGGGQRSLLLDRM